MSGFGKRILSAFVEVSADDEQATETLAAHQPPLTTAKVKAAVTAQNSSKFKQYFDKLFNEANLPGPDYYEFSKMIEAMSSIPDEKARYCAAFAGLHVQGLDKQKLLSSALEYIKLLDADANNFNSTIDAALKEKVHSKKKEMEEKEARIQQLSKEINELHNGIEALHKEVHENEEKIQANTSGYTAELEQTKSKIQHDIEKIKQHVL